MDAYFYILFELYVTLAIFFAVKQNINTLRFFLIAIVFQNIICIVAYNYVPILAIKSFTLVKEAMLYLSLAIGILKSLKLKWNTKSWYWLLKTTIRQT